MITYTRLEGVIAVVFIPFTKEDEVNLETIDRYADWIASTTIQDVSVRGTTGEFSSLIIEERQQILTRQIEASRHRLKVIVHIGSNCQKDSAQLARHAAVRHADAIASTASSFFKPDTANDLANYFKPICEATPETLFYYCNMPSITGVDLPVDELLTKGSKIIPNLVGAKFTHSNLMETQQCINLENHLFEILDGFDEILIAGISIGVVARVGSTYNYIPPVYRHVFDAMCKNNMTEARQQQLRLVEMVKFITRYGGGVRGGKAIMSLIDIDRGNCRPPLPAYTEDELVCIRKDWEYLDIRSQNHCQERDCREILLTISNRFLRK